MDEHRGLAAGPRPDARARGPAAGSAPPPTDLPTVGPELSQFLAEEVLDGLDAAFRASS